MDNYVNLILVWNIVVMLIYGLDKMLAKARKRRISEATLISCAFMLGGCGGILGMILFNHKTSKMKFRILIPIAFLFEIMVIYRFL